MSQPVPATILEFVQACATLDSDSIFELFEHAVSERLRDEVYALSSSDSPEPLREALNRLGEEHKVQSLIDY